MRKTRCLLLFLSLTVLVSYGCSSSGTQDNETPLASSLNEADTPSIPDAIECDPSSICGAVFVDTDGDMTFNTEDIPIAGVQVTNGKDITLTDKNGVFSLPKGFEYVYVTKPAGYDLPLKLNNIPVFFRKIEPEQQIYYFTLQPSEPSHSFTCLIMNDLHFEVVAGQGGWSANQDPLETFRRFADEFMSLSTKPDFIIANGDQSGVTPEDTSGLDDYVTACSRLGIPVYNAMGNPGHNDSDSDRIFYKISYRAYFGPLYYSFDYADCHFVILDTNVLSGEDGKILSFGLDETQRQWFETDLQLNRNKRILVFFHEPIENTELYIELIVKVMLQKPPDLWVDKDSILELLDSYNIAAVFFGHTHTNGIYKSRNTLYVTNGAVSGAWWGPAFNGIMDTLYPCFSLKGANANPDGTPQGYRILTATPDIMSTSYKAYTQERDICFADPAGTRIGYGRLSFLDIDVFNAYTFCLFGDPGNYESGVSTHKIRSAKIQLKLNAYSLYPIESVAYRVDEGSWNDAIHDGGIIYSGEIDASELSAGVHMITARIKDGTGKKDSVILIMTDPK